MIRILLAGQGGQGVLSAGRFLAESGLHEGKEVTYLPAYGPENSGITGKVWSVAPLKRTEREKTGLMVKLKMP